MATYKCSSISFTPISDREVVASWNFKYTASKYQLTGYQIQWRYYINGNWIRASESTVAKTPRTATYSAPENATQVCFYVKPVFAKDSGNYGSWLSKKYQFSGAYPATPTVTATMNDAGTRITATVENDDADAYYVDVRSYSMKEGNPRVFASGKRAAGLGFETFNISFDVEPGDSYSVWAMVWTKGSKHSEWAHYDEAGERVWLKAAPLPPTNIAAEGVLTGGSAGAIVSWSAGEGAETYTVQYTTAESFFVTNPSSVTTVDDLTGLSYTPTSLTTGNRYFFRVRSENEGGDHVSEWSEIVSCPIGTNPTAPTAWLEAYNVLVGDPLTLRWRHNCEDACTQTAYEVEYEVSGTTQTFSGSDDTDSLTIDTSSFSDGTTVAFKVSTKGVVDEWSPWSEVLEGTAWAQPELNITLNADDEEEPLTSLPLEITCTAGGGAIAYDLRIYAELGYTYTSLTGETVTVAAGETIWERHFDSTDNPFTVSLGAGEIPLVSMDGQTFFATGYATMASGLTAQASADMPFSVDFDILDNEVNADVSFDTDNLTAQIIPYVEQMAGSESEYTETTQSGGSYTIDTGGAICTVLSLTVDGVEVEFTEADDGQDHIVSWSQGGTAVLIWELSDLPDDFLMSVYRINADGSLTLLQSGITNLGNTAVIDPHPTLRNTSYRIVATSQDTGQSVFGDFMFDNPFPPAIVIQWDEVWRDFETVNGDDPAGAQYAGNIVRLPYNIQIDETAEPDIAQVDYIGRQSPVFYYGTQRGINANWSCEIRRSETETLAALRRLSAYMGDAYVREPSGTGYWANVVVNISQAYNSATIPVSFTVRRADHQEASV